MECRVARKYVKKNFIARGSHGDVYSGINAHTEEEVAIKLELISKSSNHLENESKLYRLLGTHVGFAHLKWYKPEGDYNVLVMSMLGPSLHDVFRSCNLRFSMKTVLMLADQLIDRFKTLHELFYVHGSVKPENFAIGVGAGRSIIYMIDFGRTRKYINPCTGLHISNNAYANTYRGNFVSINSSLGYEYSRRDDMQSVGYMLMYWLRGSLPWESTNRKDDAKVLRRKQAISVHMICRGYPIEFEEYLEYAESLPFEACPEYDYFRGIFKALFVRSGYKDDGIFDWDTPTSQRIQTTLAAVAGDGTAVEPDLDISATAGITTIPVLAAVTSEQQLRQHLPPDIPIIPEYSGNII